jgi:hypothetical protein
MKFASPYELKRNLKKRGFDFEGLQVKQVHGDKGHDFEVTPLDTASLYDPATRGFRQTPEHMELVARLNELAEVLKDSNIAVAGLTPTLTDESRPAIVGT